MSREEKEIAIAKLKTVVGEQLPLRQGRCDIAIGDNVVEVTTQIQEPLSGPQLKEVFRRIEDFVRAFPHKPDESDLIEVFAE
jgi:hypothetical protein